MALLGGTFLGESKLEARLVRLGRFQPALHVPARRTRLPSSRFTVIVWSGQECHKFHRLGLDEQRPANHCDV